MQSERLEKKSGKELEIIMIGGMVGVWAITSPIWLPIKAYQFLRDLKYAKDERVINYPYPDDFSDLEIRRLLRNTGAPQWIRPQVGEVNLDSGQIAVYSVILSDNLSPPKREFIQIEGYKLNRRKVRRFDKTENEKIIAEVTEKLTNRYDINRFDHIELMYR